MRKINKIMVKSHIAFPHEYDELAKNLNHTIEDNLKWRAEFANETVKTPQDKWELYIKMVSWVCFCDVIGTEINNRDEVFEIMKKLWIDVRNSKIYKAKPRGR
jgi:hypothetical protein